MSAPGGTTAASKPPAEADAAKGGADAKKPEEAKGLPAPKGTDAVKKVPVQFFAVRLFARPIASSGASFAFAGDTIQVTPDNKVELTHAVSEAAVLLRFYLADKNFVVLKTTTGTGRKRKTVETQAKINGKVTLKVGDAKYGFVQRKIETVKEGKKTTKKTVESSPAASITIDVTNGDSPLGSAADGVVVLRAVGAVKSGTNIPSAPPGPDTTITVEIGELQDDKKNKLSKEQLGAEHTAKDAAIEWPVTSSNRVSPEIPHKKWPSSNEESALHEKFRENWQAFTAALKEVTVGTGKLMPTIRINSVFRSPQHAYLFCWSWRIAKGQKTEKDVPPFKDEDGNADSSFPDVDWRLSKTYASAHGFLKNITAFYNPPNSVTNHLRRQAVDCNMPINITAKTDCKIKLPEKYWKIEKKTGAGGKVTFEGTEVKNTKKEESFSLEPNDGANGWVAIGADESGVNLIKSAKGGDVKTYRAGKDTSTDFTIDVSSIKLTDAEKKKIAEDVEKEVKPKAEEEFAKAVDKDADKRIAAEHTKRVRAENNKRKAARPKKPPLTKDEQDALQLTDAEKKKIRDEVEKSKRPNHDKALKKQLDAETKARTAAEEKSRKQKEHDKQHAEKAPKAEETAKKNAEAKRAKDGNFFKQLHRIGENYFGVIHFRNVMKDPPHWSYNGG